MARKHQPLAAWIGADGRKYQTDDPDVVRLRRKYGHDDWTIEPPKELSCETSGQNCGANT